jgi:hypothetical protein
MLAPWHRRPWCRVYGTRVRIGVALFADGTFGEGLELFADAGLFLDQADLSSKIAFGAKNQHYRLR